jgi:hypothetical protein
VIIKAGYDLSQIIDPYLHDPEQVNALWLILLDDELRLLGVRKVASIYGGSVAPHLAEIAAQLHQEEASHWLKYFALAHRLDRVDDANIADKVDDDDQFVNGAPSLSEFSYLGRLVADGQYAYESWPRYSFRDYIGREDLPRVASIPGPHFYDCECVACSGRQSRLEAARERLRQAGSTSIEGALGG